MNTIKEVGLETIIKNGKDFCLTMDLENTLTYDLSAADIDIALDFIKNTKIKIKNHKEKYPLLQDKIEKLQLKLEEFDTEYRTSGYIAVGVVLVFSITCILILFFQLPKITFWVAELIAIIVIVVCCMLVSQKDRQNVNNDLQEKNIIDDRISVLTKQQKELDESIYNWPSLLLELKLTLLGSNLIEMRVIATDTQKSDSDRLLAMETLLYLLHRKRVDERLVAEAEDANELARKQVEQMEATTQAIKDQTEFQAYLALVEDLKRNNK